MSKLSVDREMRRAKTCERIGALDEARSIYAEIIRTFPNNLRARNALSALAEASGKTAQPDPSQDRINQLVALYRDGQFARVVDEITELLRDFPASFALWTLLAASNHGLGRLDEAEHGFRKASGLNPDDATAHKNLGDVLKAQERFEEAVDSYQQALRIKPDYVSALSQKLRQQVLICDWSAFDEFERVKHSLGTEGEAVAPFAMFALEDHPERQAKRARLFARQTFRQQPAPLPARPQSRSGKIRVGYFSADFHDHPMLYLMAGVFREHDKSRFEIFAFSYSATRHSEMREKVSRDLDHFIDIRNLPDQAVVDLARGHGLDIAIDRKGYTQNSRSGLFAHRLAPIQVNYLAYPGSMGADFIDYIVADPVVIPESERRHYSEKIIYLPHSYQANDNRRQIAPTETLRDDFGLPETGFVFCCFNNDYKIGPREFDIWMRLLGRLEGSVLWLLRSNQWAEANLRKEATKRGIDPERLVFADRLPHAEHLARHKHAGLFIDTFNYNAHTTASDALWAGLPVVTKVGRQFAARVAASLLTAVGLPELITQTEEDYEALILDLATNSDRLAATKAKLWENRLTQPLFDTVRYTRDFEKALETVYARHL